MALFLHQKFWLARAALPGMVERGWGRLITTTSHGATGLLGQPIFAAAMGGVISMTRAIAYENAGTGVTANCLSPGGATRLHAVTRPMFEQLRADGVISEDDWDVYVNTPPPSTWRRSWRGCAPTPPTASPGRCSTPPAARWARGTATRSSALIYRGDHRTNPPWTLDELDKLVPKTLLAQS